ncbi:hypothetical protein Q5424_08310 [Conexibacter sp. JD483]|uniref:hypothetical protein n=1 Tax=unclassified Conexibacter TaxID=2627773 RepID=UPI00271721B6|nr:MULTISPECIES: hypothetical protein [unclassified Conexibacter]MDO8183959.1 hypothetical protein [Conexibacter sp. CPCC 205706]MDO8196951.1 hypothetical protein [Conexibacter sp. CPCC 205762]MDR9369079.1 hypothetical protein [Conexibacter sp. JD483]
MGKKHSVLALAAAAVASVGFAGSAHAATVTGDHWDVDMEFDCDLESFGDGLHAHNHETETEASLASTVFQVSGTSNSIWEQSVFGAAALPLKVVGDGGSYRVGFAVEAIGECDAPSVTFRLGSATVPSGARVAGYRRSETDGVFRPTTTRFDSVAGANRNIGLTPISHEDLRWGFTATGTYRLPLTASTVIGGIPTTFTGTLTFSVV